MFQDKILYFKNDTETTKALGEITLLADTVTGPANPDLTTSTAGWTLTPSLGARQYNFIAKNIDEVKIWTSCIRISVKVINKQLNPNQNKIAAHSIKEGFLRKKVVD